MRTARLPQRTPSHPPSAHGISSHRLRGTVIYELGPQETLVFEASPVATIVAWMGSGEVRLNAAALAMLGLGSHEQVHSLAELQASMGLTDAECSLARTLRGEVVGPCEQRVQLSNGERTLSIEARPIFDESRRLSGEDQACLVGVVATARDVTDETLEAEMADELLGRAAHDLRTPLTALKASAQLVARGVERLDTAARARTFQLMLAQVEKLAGRIDEVLDAARIRRGRYDLSPVELDLSQTLRELVAELESGRTPPTILLRAPPSAPALVDRARIRQIVGRLAAEATDRQSALSIEVSPSGVLAFEIEGAPIQRTTARLARSIVSRLGGSTAEPSPTRLILAFPPPNRG